MRDCPNAEIRDMLPDFARGVLPEPARATVLAHLEGCAACRDEAALLRAVRGAYAAPVVDVRRIVGALPPARVVPAAEPAGVVSLDAHRATRRQRAPLGGWRRAAAIVGVLLGGGVAWGVLKDEAPRTVATVPAPGTGTTAGAGLAPAQVATASPATPAAAGTAAAPGAAISLGGVAGELTAEEMELVLASLEEFDGVPAQEPVGDLITLATEEGSR